MVDIDFKYLEFYTYYSSTGDLDKDLNREWCFSKVFDGDDYMCNTYKIFIYRYGYKQGHDNNCLITKRQLIQHIEEAKKWHDFEYVITSIYNGYELDLTLDGELMWHKVILSWIRYSYEYPFNITLYEAFKVKKLKEFKDLNMLNLFNLIGASLNCTKHGTSIHAIGDFSNFKHLLSYEDFIQKINNCIKEDKYGEINYIIPIVKDNKFRCLKPIIDFRINHTDYWKDKPSFEQRLEIYKNNLNILKTK